MDNLYLYPTLTDQLISDAGCTYNEYSFSYLIEGQYVRLDVKGKMTKRLIDQREIWRVDSEGLRLARTVSVEYPEVLYGKDGVACKNAQLGICIIWTNRLLRQMGYIKPVEEKSIGGRQIYVFQYEFAPGQIKGDLTLETVMYIKQAANEPEEGEEHLINSAGVTVGVIDQTVLEFDNNYMEFPIRDINDKNQPLWWLELNQWEDPTSDSFNEDTVCLYLNSYYDCCPKVGDTIKNIDILIEIISQAYLMILMKIKDLDITYFSRTLEGKDLEPGSISMVMYYFCSSCDPVIRDDPIDMMQKKIHSNIERMLKGESE